MSDGSISDMGFLQMATLCTISLGNISIRTVTRKIKLKKFVSWDSIVVEIGDRGH